MPRRVSLIVLLGLIIVLVLSFGVSASAAPAENDEGGNAGEASIVQSELVQNQDELAQTQQQASLAAEKYNDARSQVDQLNRDIAETVVKQADAEDNFKKAQASLQNQAVSVYKAGPLYLLDFLLSAESFSDFANRLWFSIKALLGAEEEVQDWKKERDNLEQIKVDLKSSLSKQQGVVEEAEAQREEALNKAGALESELNSLDESNDDTVQYDEGRRADAEQLIAGLNALAEEGPLDSPESLPGGGAAVDSPQEEVSTFPKEAADAVGLQGLSPEDKQVLDKALADTTQAGNAAQEAQRQQDEAARRVVRDLANSLASPTGTQNTSLDKGEQQNASLNKGEAHNAPLNKGGGTPTTSVPTVTDNRDLLNNARQFEAAKNNALQANQNALDKGLGLANALEQAQRPAAGTQTTSSGKVTAGPNGAGTSNVSAKPGTGGGSGPAAVSLGLSKVGAGYELGSDGKDGKFSCTGLLRWIGAQLGYPDLPWDPSGWYSFPRRDGPAHPGDVVVTPGGVGLALGPDQLVMANDADLRVGTYPINIMGPPTIVVPPWNT